MRHIPDVPGQLKQSYQNVSRAMNEAGGKGWAARGMNTVTSGLVAAAGECVRLPVNVLVVPVAKTVNDAVRGTVKGALNVTGNLLASIPWLPAPRSSQQRDLEIASLHDPIGTPSLPRPHDTGGGTGQTA